METARENMKQAEKWRTKFIEVKKQLDNVLAGNSSLSIKKKRVPVIQGDGTFNNYGKSLEQDVEQDVVQDVQEFVPSVQVVQKYQDWTSVRKSLKEEWQHFRKDTKKTYMSLLTLI